MNSRRPSTSSPISVRNISSAFSASFSVTFSSVRCAGSSVVVPQLLGVHLAQPLEPRDRHPLLAEPADLGHQLAQVRPAPCAPRRAPARTAPAARGRPPAAAAPGRAGSKPGVLAASPAPGSAPAPRATRPACNARSASSGFGGRRRLGALAVATTVVGEHQLLAELLRLLGAERVHLGLACGTSAPSPPKRTWYDREHARPFAFGAGTPSSVCPRRSRFTTAVSTSSSTGSSFAQRRRRSPSRRVGRSDSAARAAPCPSARGRSAPSPSPRASGRSASPSSASPCNSGGRATKMCPSSISLRICRKKNVNSSVRMCWPSTSASVRMMILP